MFDWQIPHGLFAVSDLLGVHEIPIIVVEVLTILEQGAVRITGPVAPPVALVISHAHVPGGAVNRRRTIRGAGAAHELAADG